MKTLSAQAQTSESKQKFDKVANYHSNLAQMHLQLAQGLLDGVEARGQGHF